MLSFFNLEKKNYLFSFVFSIYFFFWSQQIVNFDTRYILLLLIPITIFYKDEFKEFKKRLILFSIINIFIIIHLVINNINNKIPINNIFNPIFGLIISSIIIIFYRDFIIKNIKNIIGIFLIIILAGFFWEVFYNEYYFSERNFDCLHGWYSRDLQFKFFSENSHFGMSCAAIILFLSYKIEMNNKYNIYLILLIIFLFLFLSTTLLTGVMVSTFLILVFNYKILSKYNKIISIILILTTVIMIGSKKQCSVRFSQTIEGGFTAIKYFLYNEKINQTPWRADEDQKDIVRKALNVSSEVLLNSYTVALKSLKDHPFGLGLNNYYIGHAIYTDKTIKHNEHMLFWEHLNEKDGSNNLSKMVTEFGVFSFIIFFLIFKFLKLKNINLPEKSFIFTIIITQLIRGAGYFNGSFLLCLLLIMSLTLINIKNEQK